MILMPNPSNHIVFDPKEPDTLSPFKGNDKQISANTAPFGILKYDLESLEKGLSKGKLKS